MHPRLQSWYSSPFLHRAVGPGHTQHHGNHNPTISTSIPCLHRAGMRHRAPQEADTGRARACKAADTYRPKPPGSTYLLPPMFALRAAAAVRPAGVACSRRWLSAKPAGAIQFDDYTVGTPGPNSLFTWGAGTLPVTVVNCRLVWLPPP